MSSLRGCPHPHNADTTREEWLRENYCDSLAVIVSNPTMLHYTAAAKEEHPARTRIELLNKLALRSKKETS
jgi:hypothetical protein